MSDIKEDADNDEAAELDVPMTDLGLERRREEMSILKLETNRFAGDSLELYFHNGVLTVQIDEPWAGSTETGFGQTCSTSLEESQVKELLCWLSAKVEESKNT